MINKFTIHEVTKIGDYHDNHCEDFVVKADVGQHRLLMAVMDGCTMGRESQFAAALIGKILRKISREAFYKEYAESQTPPLPEQLKQIFKQLFGNLQQLQNQLQLERSELLSTIVLCIVDLQNRQAEILSVGDGLLAVNGKYIEYDQENVPDYLGYHLKSDFESWYNQQEQRYSAKQVQDLSLSTDGIFTFSRFSQDPIPDKHPREILDFLLLDSSDLSNERMFVKKLDHIERLWGLRPTDDLGILRLAFSHPFG